MVTVFFLNDCQLNLRKVVFPIYVICLFYLKLIILMIIEAPGQQASIYTFPVTFWLRKIR